LKLGELSMRTGLIGKLVVGERCAHVDVFSHAQDRALLRDERKTASNSKRRFHVPRLTRPRASGLSPGRRWQKFAAKRASKGVRARPVKAVQDAVV
jgi:hypothetical protein